MCGSIDDCGPDACRNELCQQEDTATVRSRGRDTSGMCGDQTTSETNMRHGQVQLCERNDAKISLYSPAEFDVVESWSSRSGNVRRRTLQHATCLNMERFHEEFLFGVSRKRVILLHRPRHVRRIWEAQLGATCKDFESVLLGNGSMCVTKECECGCESVVMLLHGHRSRGCDATRGAVEVA